MIGDVGTGGYRNVCTRSRPLASKVTFGSRNRKRPGGFEHRSCIEKSVADRRADLIDAYRNHLVDKLLTERERMVSHPAYSYAVSEQPDVGQVYRAPSLQCGLQ